MIRYNPSINEGLNTKQVQYRIKNNFVNKSYIIETKSTFRIILDNLVTLYNLLNLYIAILFILVNSYKYILFLCVIVINFLINTIEELKTKRIINRVIDNKRIMVNVIRDSKNIVIDSNDLVLDDITYYKSGSIIAADSIVLDGIIRVDESHLSGKEKIVVKNKGDMVFAKSKIISGKCTTRVDKVGKDNYIYKIMNIIKYKNSTNSYIKKFLDNIIKFISSIVLLLSIVLFIQTKSIIDTANYIDKIMPIGLIILSILVFILSIIKLRKDNVLVKNLSCIEKLANIDTICFDKTGTLITNESVVNKVILLNKKYDYEKILSIIGKNCSDYDSLLKAVGKKYNKKYEYKTFKKEYEDNYLKVYINGSKYMLGNPIALSSDIDVSEYNDYQVLLLKSDKDDIALILLTSELRSNLKELINKLYEENLNIKIISGDNETVLKSVAKKIGIKKIKCIDMSINNTNMNHQIVEEYNVFCNVSPEQKRILVNALKNNGHMVATVGDGLNDLLALTASNSSITILNDKNEVYGVCDFIINDNRLDGINSIIMESRRVINNICKIILLYLIKTIYSFLMVITYGILSMKYPFKFEIYSILFILLPAVLILFEKDYSRPNIDFKNILKRSMIVSFIMYIAILSILIINCFISIDIYKYILTSILIIEMFTLLKFKLLKVFWVILLIIMAISCIIFL